MKRKLAQFLNVGLGAACFGLGAYFLWPTIHSKIAADNFECAFDAVSTENAYYFGRLGRPIRQISLTGFIDDPFDKVLYDFEGEALVSSETETITASARGSVFVNEEGEPNGLLLTLENDQFGQDWLNVFTLNEDGILDFSQSRAFVFSDQARGEPFRLTYPLVMRCDARLAL
jgi:hypothetical protein